MRALDNEIYRIPTRRLGRLVAQWHKVVHGKTERGSDRTESAASTRQRVPEESERTREGDRRDKESDDTATKESAQ